MRNEILMLSEEDIREILDPQTVIAIVEDVFRSLANGTPIMPAISRITVDESANNFFLILPSALTDQGIVGMKWFSGFMTPKPGYPFSHGNLILVCDTQTGSPLAITGASTITAMRTAGGHAVIAAKYLARKNPMTLSVLGCGNQARAGIRGFLTQFASLERINIYDSWQGSMDSIEALYGDKVQIVKHTNPESAIQGADIILTVSTAKEIQVRPETIAKGTTLLALNAFVDVDPKISETADKWVLGNWAEDTHNIIDSPLLRHDYPLDENRVYAEMADIVSGKKAGRESDDEIILYTHMGMGVFDIACAHAAYKKATKMNRGSVFVLSAE